MGEGQVKEPRAAYQPGGEQATEVWPGQLPPYFERFIEERDRRLASEFRRLEAAINHNALEISRLSQEVERRFAEAKEERKALWEEMNRRFAEAREERKALWEEMLRLLTEARGEHKGLREHTDRRFTELREEMDRRFAEAKEEREALREEIRALRTEMHTQFRWIIGLLLPLVIGVLLIIAKVFFGWIP